MLCILMVRILVVPYMGLQDNNLLVDEGIEILNDIVITNDSDQKHVLIN